MHPILLIPHYNRRDLLDRVLQALKKQTAVHQTLVIDNGSTDGSVELAEKSGVQVLPLDRNYGFAYAVNRGIEWALSQGASHIGIVNNDVVPSPTWLEELLRSEASFVCGKIVSEADPTVLDGTFDLISSTGLSFRAGNGQSAVHPTYQHLIRICSAPMTAVVFRSEVFETIGLLDESYGSYLEDVDFGIRCTLANIQGEYLPAALATHRGNATLGAWHPETIRLISRNQVLLLAKHYPGKWIWSYGCSAVVGQLLWGIAVIRRGKGRAYFRGKKEGIQLWKSMRKIGSDEIRIVFRRQAEELHHYASGWFQKVIAWIS